MEDPLGIHYIIELYGCESTSLDNLPLIEQTLVQSADIAGATIISSKFHKFSPQGVSGVVVIAESHLSIHTWPELGYAALDLYTCNLKLDIEKTLRLIKEVFSPEEMIVKYVERGILDFERRRNLEVKDYIMEDNLVAGGKK